MAARQALKKMLLPSVLALLIPIVGAFFETAGRFVRPQPRKELSYE